MRFSIGVLFMFTLITLTIVVSGAKRGHRGHKGYRSHGGHKKSGKGHNTRLEASELTESRVKTEVDEASEGKTDDSSKNSDQNGKGSAPQLAGLGPLIQKTISPLTQLQTIPGISGL